MTSQDDKKRWKEEAETLKKDLANRPKEVVKREVPIRLKKQTKSTSSSPSSTSSHQDDWTRQQLGL